MNETILIVDDDVRIRELLTESLNAIGYQTIAASDGHEALATVRTQPIDCVVSDIKMPELDGLNLLHHIKAEHPAMPVIMITGFAFHQHREQATHEGADGFLVKPFRLEKIEEVLLRVLSRARAASAPTRVIRDILIVEDDVEFRVLLAEIVEALGYNPMSVADAESAVRQINQRCPDALITDYKLPTMSGEDLIRAVKSTHADLPIVLITGYAPSISGREFADGAADAFLMKPFRIDRIGTILKSLENPAAATA
ncbi:MAG: response regulator [candidate division Zixibacteria bacterium]|nr:response regulator [candidate division Zixibacteria bacterium]